VVATAGRFEALLDRAIEEAHHVVALAGRPGVYRVSSASVPGRYYTTSEARCSCPAGKAGCKHRALVFWLEREGAVMGDQERVLADGTPDDMRPGETAYQWAARHAPAVDYVALAAAGLHGWTSGAANASQTGGTAGQQGWEGAARAIVAGLREQGFAPELRLEDLAKLDAAWQLGGGQMDFAVACRIEAVLRPGDVVAINAAAEAGAE
jgi:hypothetical protein